MDTIVELLSDINDNLTLLKGELGRNNYLRNVLEHAVIPEKKFLLPEGDPPYKVRAGLSHAEIKGSFWQEARKLGTYLRTDINTTRLEVLFIQALEGMDKQTAEIFLMVKDQALDTKYPNITLEKLKEIGYIS